MGNESYLQALQSAKSYEKQNQIKGQQVKSSISQSKKVLKPTKQSEDRKTVEHAVS